ncbi:MAG TPA: VOC family protein [Pyrinomonadaceae bacterium]|nr:VOC family protein [Pyrinomonadaceae bacterium]
MELDHLFVCTSVGAPEVERLTALGLTEGQSNLHPGQGTACRRLFFRNAYLEFLWVHKEGEARGEAAEPLRLWERWLYQQTGYSPFGICLRPTAQGDKTVGLPFETWGYRPPYLPDPLQIDVADTADHPAEPLLFHTSFGVRPDAYPSERRQPLEHPAGLKEITEIKISLPERTVSKALRAIEEVGLVKLATAKAHLLEVTFDRGARGRAADFRPGLPLFFQW